MTVYVRAKSMPLVLEFLGSAETDAVSEAVELAIRHRYVLTVELFPNGPSGPATVVMVNFAALEDVIVQSQDPRADADWDDTLLVYSAALAEFRAAASADLEE